MLIWRIIWRLKPENKEQRFLNALVRGLCLCVCYYFTETFNKTHWLTLQFIPSKRCVSAAGNKIVSGNFETFSGTCPKSFGFFLNQKRKGPVRICSNILCPHYVKISALVLKNCDTTVQKRWKWLKFILELIVFWSQHKVYILLHSKWLSSIQLSTGESKDVLIISYSYTWFTKYASPPLITHCQTFFSVCCIFLMSWLVLYQCKCQADVYSLA